MTLLQNDPITQIAFSVHENKGVFAVLLGSGLSRSAGIPTGWEITLDLVRRVAKTPIIPFCCKRSPLLPASAERYCTGTLSRTSRIAQKVEKSRPRRTARSH